MAIPCLPRLTAGAKASQLFFDSGLWLVLYGRDSTLPMVGSGRLESDNTALIGQR